jgi:hypothetical protein
MIQTSSLSRRLTTAQEHHATTLQSNKAIVWRLYTGNKGNLHTLVNRYFGGATLFPAIGLRQGVSDVSIVIEILGTWADLQRIVWLVGDIKTVNGQQTVLVTYHSVSQLEV